MYTCTHIHLIRSSGLNVPSGLPILLPWSLAHGHTGHISLSNVSLLLMWTPRLGHVFSVTSGTYKGPIQAPTLLTWATVRTDF